MDILQYAAVVSGLTEILGIRVIDTSDSANHYSKVYLGKCIKGVIDFHNSGDSQTSKNEFFKLAFLLKHLREIQAGNPIAFAGFRSAILKCRTSREFFGLRMEIYAAASLTRAGAMWEKTESPDFRVLMESPIYVECASVHLSAPKDRDVLYKIESVIDAKGKKFYANDKTVLFIDVTNLVFNHVFHNIPLDGDAVKSCAKASLRATKFGSVLLFSYLNSDVYDRIEASYWRVDNDSINHNLLVFLNLAYPITRPEQKPFVAMFQG